MAGYNTGPFATSTGTSREGLLCATDGLGPCSAVVLGGEPPAASGLSNPDGAPGAPEPQAKVRVFHVYPLNLQAPQQLSDAIVKLWSEDLLVKAAMRGGLRSERLGTEMIDALKQVLHAHTVPIEYDQKLTRDACSDDSIALGGVIHANRVYLTDDVRVLPHHNPLI